MNVSTPVNAADPGIEVRTFFLRERCCLVARADFGSLYVDYYLHLSANRLHPKPVDDTMFKRALAGFVLHSASRPWNEMTAWTMNFQEPLLNLFLTGDNADGSVAGRVFDENVKVLPENVFYADIVRHPQPARRSVAPFVGDDPLRAVEAYYTHSEQRPARYFQLGEEDFAMVSAHPDYDASWFDALDAEGLRAVLADEGLVPMERRVHRWHCGCNQARMLQVLAPSFRADPDALFEGDPAVEINCPRCAARHVVTREALAAHVSAGA